MGLGLFEKNDWRSHEWKDAIEPHTNPAKALGIFVGGIVIGFFVAVIFVPIAGVVVGVSIIVWAYWIEWGLANAEDSVLEDGLIAPFIRNKRVFHLYLQRVGKERVLAEIEQAIEHNHQIAPFAENWYNAVNKGQTPLSEKPPLQKLKEKQENPQESPNATTLPASNNQELKQPENESDNSEENPFWEIPYGQLIILSGEQGSGKTTTLGTIVEQKLQQGAFVLFCDPFYQAGKFHGVSVVGRNPDTRFEEITEAFEWFSNLVEGRIQKQAKYEDYDPVDDIHVSLVCDEFTNLGNRLDPKVLATLWDNSLTTLRRLNLSVVLATHNLRIPGLGGQKAVGSKTEAIRSQSMQFVLKSKRNVGYKDRGESPKIPSGYAWFKCEGEEEFEKVKVPEDFRPSNLVFDFRSLTGKDKHPDWKKETGLES
jgi:hypothetical protein